MRLKLSTAWPATGYLIISPTFKPLITGDVPVITPLVAIWIWSATPKPVIAVFCKTRSPPKSAAYPVIELVSWYTDFTSLILFIFNDFIDLTIDSSPFIIICSPLTNVPDVCVSLTAVVLFTFVSTKPVAPLLLPFTKDAAGHCSGLKAVLTSRSTNV